MFYIDDVKPIYHIYEEDELLIKKIEECLKDINIDDNNKKISLEKKSKVRSIHSSLAIENNSLSIEAVESIIDNKMVLGSRKEVQEVKNAIQLYENIKEYNWKDEEDFLKAHQLMMMYFDDAGIYRTHGEGIQKGDKIIYAAPPSIFVPDLMKSLFKFLSDNENEIHPLILASIFHYYFVTIHPFRDGNGRMARFWVSVILTNWNPLFEIIPIEEEIYLNQSEYYDAIEQCHNNGNANIFIKFMLKCIYESIIKVK